jgi:hypothetical protein
MPQFQPLPLAELGVRPLGRASVAVTAPVVDPLPPFETTSVKLPVPPRCKVELLAVFDSVRLGVPGVAPMLTVTEPIPTVDAPPPVTLAEFVTEPGALPATLTETVMA